LFSLQLTLASNAASSIRDPKLLLALRTIEGDAIAGTSQSHLLELSAADLGNAVLELERAAAVMHVGAQA
jgi:hypothetical protein